MNEKDQTLNKADIAVAVYDTHTQPESAVKALQCAAARAAAYQAHL